MNDIKQLRNSNNSILGEIKIENKQLYFKRNNSYEFKKCKNISNLKYFDLNESKSKFLNESFNGNVYMCGINNVVISEKDYKLCGYKYSSDIFEEDISNIVLNIKLNGG